MNWNVALSTGIFLSEPLPTILPRIRESGLRLIEVSAFTAHFDYKDLDLVQKTGDDMHKLGLRAISMHSPYSKEIDVTMLNEVDRKHSVAEIEIAIDALAILGGTKLVVHAGSEAEEANGQIPKRLSQSLRSLTEIYNYCQKRDIKLVIENMLGHLVGGRIQELQWILSRLPRQNVGVCLDSGHSFLAKNLLKAVRTFAPNLSLVHAHDNKGIYDDHLPPGEGKIDWPKFLDALAAARFEGDIVIEVLGGNGGRDVLERVRQSVVFLKDCSLGKTYSLDV